MRLGEASHLNVDAIPTGSLSLDIALGVGGIPRGRVTEIYGPESSGKTTICQHIVAEAQRMGGTAAFIDMEHALDPTYAEQCGVDVDNLFVKKIFIDGGPSLKRIRPRAMGRATGIIKRTSHVTVVLDEN